MNVMKKLAVGVTALALCVSTMTSGMSSLLQTAAVDDGNDDWLHAVGSRLYDKDGNEVWLTGANWFGFNCSENVAHGLYAADIDEFLSNVADRGINVIRFPISSELLLSWMNGAPNPVSSVQAGYDPPYVDINKDFVLEDGKTVKDSMEIFDIVMQKCKNYGIKAIIDVHSPDANNSGHNYNLWYGKADITTDLWIETLTWLADKYKNDDTIIAYDLKN
jgi:aryl-phospho-beta-D-glucosidase BglC (GH1 family)